MDNKPLYKRRWFWVIAVFVLIFVLVLVQPTQEDPASRQVRRDSLPQQFRPQDMQARADSVRLAELARHDSLRLIRAQAEQARRDSVAAR